MRKITTNALALTTLAIACWSCSGNKKAENTSADSVVVASDSASIDTFPDPAFRVIVQNKNGEVLMPSGKEDWSIDYTYVVPPIPTQNWNYQNQTFYVWGDIDFDYYGANGDYRISDYMFNQIGPEIMIGKGLSSDNNFIPSWEAFSTWKMQAQYFWMKKASPQDSSFALCGELVPVEVGDTIYSSIIYSVSSGKIHVKMKSSGGKRSEIIIDRPFPNEPTLFSSWSDFFQKARQASNTDGVYAQPVLNVESHYVDQSTLCSVLPFQILQSKIPGISWPSGYEVIKSGDYSCDVPLANLVSENG